ncbi:unnamed protein product [Peronospora belbahrii]|uniref:Peptidase S1 domain-containing protein n=1 Tax=Peronospora belbahrii TaxID=622444 RepID=A0ABN8CRZ4_9STRA|nr:unnamed protein product [Peronospora belbahrii]
MKFLSAFIAALTITVSADAFTNHVERKLILGGTIVPEGRKLYYTGLRHTAEGKNICGAALIAPLHVLTASHCITYDIRWASIGSQYNNGTHDGEQIKVVSVMIHPNSSIPLPYSNDFAILELEVASSIKPVKLAKADNSDFKDGATVTTVGTGHTSEGLTAVEAHERQRVDSNLITNEQCKEDGRIVVDDSMVCVAGQISMGFCDGDLGGPLFIESSDDNTDDDADDDADDVLIGIASWRNARDGSVCGRGMSLPMVYSRVSSVRKWMDPIITTSCFV